MTPTICFEPSDKIKHRHKQAKINNLNFEFSIIFPHLVYIYNLLKSSGDFLLWGKTNAITLVENIETVFVIVILTVWE